MAASKMKRNGTESLGTIEKEHKSTDKWSGTLHTSTDESTDRMTMMAQYDLHSEKRSRTVRKAVVIDNTEWTEQEKSLLAGVLMRLCRDRIEVMYK